MIDLPPEANVTYALMGAKAFSPCVSADAPPKIPFPHPNAIWAALVTPQPCSLMPATMLLRDEIPS